MFRLVGFFLVFLWIMSEGSNPVFSHSLRAIERVGYDVVTYGVRCLSTTRARILEKRGVPAQKKQLGSRRYSSGIRAKIAHKDKKIL